MASTSQQAGAGARRVAVVTGGGGGIGTAAAVQLGRRGATVIVMDPGVGVQGEPLNEPTAEQTAKLVEREGGVARASTASVTDAEALKELFQEVVDEFGTIDSVVNTAGILRFPNFVEASQDDWMAVLDVHFNGYRNVLQAALPHMVAAGSGQVVGFTSGVGLARTIAEGPAYGCAKRAVASLTWQLGRLVPQGISVNALSPIAASRMVREALIAGGANPKGLDLTAMPQPEDMGPAAAYMASDEFSWSRGQVLFSAGSELTLIAPPRLLEAVRTRDTSDFGAVLDTVVPVVLVPAEQGQATTGGTNPRFGSVFDTPARPSSESGARCLVVSDDELVAAAICRSLEDWGVSPVGVGAWLPFDNAARTVPTDFPEVAATVARAAEAAGGLEAIVVALRGGSTSSDGDDWHQLLDSHATTADDIVGRAAWMRAAMGHALRSGVPLRSVHITRATTYAGRTVAQASAQMARCANDTGGAGEINAFAVSLETSERSDEPPLGALVARLVAGEDTTALRGAELTVRPGRVELRSHPGPSSTVSFGGPAIPAWVNDVLRDATMRYPL